MDISKPVNDELAKLSHIKYAGSGYSGYWEIEEKQKNGNEEISWLCKL